MDNNQIAKEYGASTATIARKIVDDLQKEAKELVVVVENIPTVPEWASFKQFKESLDRLSKLRAAWDKLRQQEVNDE